MKKTFKGSIKYISCGILATSVMLAACLSVACNKVKVPDMNITYGPEIGLAEGQVDLTGETPIISISAIKAEVGMNIDYLSGVTIANEGDFPDLEIWVDASTVDIFTPGNYTAIYTFNYDDKTVSEEVTVTITEKPAVIEPSASSSNQSSQNTTSKDNSSNEATSSKENPTSSKESPSSSKNENNTSKEPGTTTKPQPTSSSNQATTTKPPATTTKPTSTTKPIVTTKPTSTKPSSSNAPTTSKNTNTTDETTTTREIITTSGNKQTSSKYIGNYTIELLSGKTVTIRNTTSKYIVSTRTDVSYKDRNGYTYKVSKLIITYNTGAEQILETVEERMD